MSGLKINRNGCRKQLLSGLAHFYVVCCGKVHFPVSKSDIGCLKLMQRIRHRRSFCRLQIYTGRSSGSWDWKCNGGTVFTSGEKSSKRNYLVKSASDDHSVFPFYMGLAHTSGVKASIIEAVNVFIAILVAGFCFIRKDYIKKNHWLHSGICRSSID